MDWRVLRVGAKSGRRRDRGFRCMIGDDASHALANHRKHEAGLGSSLIFTGRGKGRVQGLKPIGVHQLPCNRFLFR